jgi:hypothetical protein
MAPLLFQYIGQAIIEIGHLDHCRSSMAIGRMGGFLTQPLRFLAVFLGISHQAIIAGK